MCCVPFCPAFESSFHELLVRQHHPGKSVQIQPRWEYEEPLQFILLWTMNFSGVGAELIFEDKIFIKEYNLTFSERSSSRPQPLAPKDSRHHHLLSVKSGLKNWNCWQPSASGSVYIHDADPDYALISNTAIWGFCNTPDAPRD